MLTSTIKRYGEAIYDILKNISSLPRSLALLDDIDLLMCSVKSVIIKFESIMTKSKNEVKAGKAKKVSAPQADRPRVSKFYEEVVNEWMKPSQESRVNPETPKSKDKKVSKPTRK